MQTASFFSASLVERQPAFDFIDLYMPANPFNSLANNVVPAVVLFSLILGIAVVGHAFGSYALGATGGVNGAGKTLPPMLLDAAVYLVVLPPALVLAARHSEGALAPLWWSLTGVNAVLAVVHWCYMRFARWV